MNERILKYLNEIIAEISDEKEITLNLETSFITLGLDSYDAMSFVGRLKEDFEELPVTIFLQCQTTQDLINYLEKNFNEELKKVIS
ncbi:phosphopantetheine attachment domain protein [Bacteriovorax sp. BAL6_X]|uniref:acyl carrier protein n=1 Tax=Bacteriovorax sp. BAL6_X TaxID=1201290 RepID=UPI000386682D|nr:acyl carrier protein [Bacteriovorax sp. BAL6_X]EPZ49310.1 phosphopantetheine attachment domain protein [Bacteriovorax sp. BAL6_X]